MEAGIFVWKLYGELAERARRETGNYVWKKSFVDLFDASEGYTG